MDSRYTKYYEDGYCISIKILESYLMDIDKLIPKYIWGRKNRERENSQHNTEGT